MAFKLRHEKFQPGNRRGKGMSFDKGKTSKKAAVTGAE